MNRAGKLLRDLQRDHSLHDSQETLRARKAGEQAHAEMLVRFGPITADNATSAMRWQTARIYELLDLFLSRLDAKAGA